MSSTSSDDDDNLNILTPHEILVAGLKALKYSKRRINRCKDSTNQGRLRNAHGLNSVALAQLWEDLQTTSIEEARLDPNQRDLLMFFISLNFLKKYRTEKDQDEHWQISDRKTRDNNWHYVKKIAALRSWKIKWPDDNFGNDIWVMSVDGVHIKSYEKRSNEKKLNLDPKIFSYKHRCAGYLVEIGLALHESKCVWIRGPYKAGTVNDIKVFTTKGLKDKLEQCGKVAIGDSGYTGYSHICSTPNIGYDEPEVRKFKTRARMRHERYNAMLETFKCMVGPFRSSEEKLSLCLDAVAVLCEYKMEHGEPLFDI